MRKWNVSILVHAKVDKENDNEKDNDDYDGELIVHRNSIRFHYRSLYLYLYRREVDS